MTVLYNSTIKTIVHFVATDTHVIVGNNTVSNVTSLSNEVIFSADIAQVWHGCDAGGSWIVERGTSSANSIVAVFDGTGHQQYSQAGALISANNTGESLYVTLDGSTNGYIMIELRKESQLS